MSPRGPDAVRHLRQTGGRLLESGVRNGLSARWVGYRGIQHETVPQHVARLRQGRPQPVLRYETVQPRAVAVNPLPRNLASPQQLPDDRGWWGYSFRDVPERISDETFLATLPECRIVGYHDEQRSGDYYPAIVTRDHHALQLREVRFRRRHAAALRTWTAPQTFDRATWVLERVYHNHSHWLTAHLPKLLLLQQRGQIESVLLPEVLSPTLEGAMREVGLDPARFRRFDPARPVQVGELTVLGTDRFRPELLQPVQRALTRGTSTAPHRRVLISRAGAGRRRLVNEDLLWARLETAGFERVQMENLSFAEQAALMRETSVLVALHGAGLTNMVACQPGTHVVEIADLSFPNPNFYALASALRHPYWLVAGEPVGTAHPLERDVRVDVDVVGDVLGRVLAEVARS